MRKILATTAAAFLATAAIAIPASAQSDNSASQDAPGQIKKLDPNLKATDRAPGQLQNNGSVDSAAEVAPGTMKPSKETTASISVSAEQETQLRTAFGAVAVEPVETDVEIAVGSTVPDTVTLSPLPRQAVEVVPTYANYEYFVAADGQIVIVAPETNEIVYVLSS